MKEKHKEQIIEFKKLNRLKQRDIILEYLKNDPTKQEFYELVNDYEDISKEQLIEIYSNQISFESQIENIFDKKFIQMSENKHEKNDVDDLLTSL